jgi:hypothetical protein
MFVTTSGIILLFLGAAAVLLSRQSEPLYRSIEKRFLDNLNEKERRACSQHKASPCSLGCDTGRVCGFPTFPIWSAKRLEESKFKENTGTTIAMIDRGGKKSLCPRALPKILLPF